MEVARSSNVLHKNLTAKPSSSQPSPRSRACRHATGSCPKLAQRQQGTTALHPNAQRNHTLQVQRIRTLRSRSGDHFIGSKPSLNDPGSYAAAITRRTHGPLTAQVLSTVGRARNSFASMHPRHGGHHAPYAVASCANALQGLAKVTSSAQTSFASIARNQVSAARPSPRDAQKFVTVL